MGEFLRVTMGSASVTLQQAEKSMTFKDKNRDGSLDEQELVAACDGVDARIISGWCESLEKAAAVKKLFRALDKNSDGMVVASEFLEFLRVTMGSASVALQQAEKSMAFKDENKNGTLDEQELAAACDGVDAGTIAGWCESLEKVEEPLPGALRSKAMRVFAMAEKGADGLLDAKKLAADCDGSDMVQDTRYDAATCDGRFFV